jgi:ribose 5-phosphate isomerase B
MSMKIIVGADHAGYALKEHLKKVLAHWRYFDVVDLGTNSDASVDYPDYAAAVARAVVEHGEGTLGLLVCGTGIGMAIAANKVKGARAAACSDPFSAQMARQHNDANVLCIGARVVGPGTAEMAVKLFLECGFEGGRHERRVEKIKALE